MSIPPSLVTQRSHVLFVLSEPDADESAFLAWYGGEYADRVVAHPEVLGGRRYEISDIDLTGGRHRPLPFRHLAIYDLSIDGADEAAAVIDDLVEAHRASGVAREPATWISFHIGDIAGTETPAAPYVTLAFANGYPGRETEFREWYPTRHIRHALHIPALVSGRCHFRTVYQHATAAALDFDIIAVYEQTGTPEDVIHGLTSNPPEMFDFPSMDTARFAESSYRRVG